jgi:hypothetical protein
VLVQPLLQCKSSNYYIFWLYVCKLRYAACVILTSVVCPAVQYFSTLSHKRHDFRKFLLNKKCVFWFSLQLLSEAFLILRGPEQDIIKNVKLSSFTVFFRYSCNILKVKFSRQIFKNSQIWNLAKNNPVAAELFHADRLTDIIELIITFITFSNVPKIDKKCFGQCPIRFENQVKFCVFKINITTTTITTTTTTTTTTYYYYYYYYYYYCWVLWYKVACD